LNKTDFPNFSVYVACAVKVKLILQDSGKAVGYNISLLNQTYPQIHMAYKVKARIESETPVYYDGSTTYH